MTRTFRDGNPPLRYSAAAAAICRAILAKDAQALDALIGDADEDELTQLLLAAAWLSIQTLRTIHGNDMAAVDAELADCQAQFLEILARHPE